MAESIINSSIYNVASELHEHHPSKGSKHEGLRLERSCHFLFEREQPVVTLKKRAVKQQFCGDFGVPDFSSITKKGFTTNNKFELFTPEQEASFKEQKYAVEVSLALKALLANGKLPHFNKELVKSVLLFKNKNIFEVVGWQLQLILRNIKEQAEWHNNKKFNQQAQIFIGNIIALLPYLYPEDFQSDKIVIPQLNNGIWGNISYKISLIPLLPKNSFLRKILEIFGKPIDIVELEPIEGTNANVPAIRVLQGTTYPGGKGMVQTILADTFPFFSVGEFFLVFFYSAIRESIVKNTKRKVTLYGQSLGASFAMLLALAFPKNVKHVMAYAPAKLFSWTITKLKKRFCKDSKVPKITVLIQDGDLIPNVGNALPKEAEVLHLAKKGKGSAIGAHAKPSSSLKNVKVTRLDTKDLQGWTTVGIIHLVLSPAIFLSLGATFTIWRIFVTLAMAPISLCKSKQYHDDAKTRIAT